MHNEIPDAITTIKNPLRYYLSTFITKESLLNLYNNMKGQDLKIGTPNMTKEEFWEYQLGPSMTGNFYSQWSYPKNLIEKLQDVKRICKQRDIDMLILLPPTHVDLQQKVKDYGLENEYAQYKINLSSIAPVFDYELTKNKDLFNDPYHFIGTIGESIVSDILGTHCQYCIEYINSEATNRVLPTSVHE